MALNKDEISGIEAAVNEAQEFWSELMDVITGGAFKRGWREATAVERLREWDALQPEQIETLRQTKGDEWVVGQATQVERIRKAVAV